MKLKIIPIFAALAAMLYSATAAQATVVSGTSVCYGAGTGCQTLPVAQQTSNQNGQVGCSAAGDGTCDSSGIWSLSGQQAQGDTPGFAEVSWYQMNIPQSTIRNVPGGPANRLVERVALTYSQYLLGNTDLEITLKMRTGLPGCNRKPYTWRVTSSNFNQTSHVYKLKWRSTCFLQSTGGVNASVSVAGVNGDDTGNFNASGTLTQVSITPQLVS